MNGGKAGGGKPGMATPIPYPERITGMSEYQFGQPQRRASVRCRYCGGKYSTEALEKAKCQNCGASI